MTNNLEQIPQQFPEIFPKPIPRNHANIDQDTLPWGFECGDGWYHVIHDLCQTLTVHCNATGQPVPQAIQVKEKFGGLRFYVDSGTKEVYDIIDKFESYSYKVCEVCGVPGTKRGGGWIRTLCDEHHKGTK